MLASKQSWFGIIFLYLCCVSTTYAQLDPATALQYLVHDDGRVATASQTFPSRKAFYQSDTFKNAGLRCATRPSLIGFGPGTRGQSDCTLTLTNPLPIYSPSVEKYRIPVVVHVIQDSNGDGNISNATIASQIDILNEDFLSLPGTNGAPGTDVQIKFYLATTDPLGNPTNGITRSINDTWFADDGEYWNTLAWDTHRYVNIYTNSVGGALGYVPDLPQGGLAGNASDRVVILWSAFGRDSAGGPPFDQGRTLTHEIGHYLGLEHTFFGGCASGDCYTVGDLICDTSSQVTEGFGCPVGQNSCPEDGLDSIHNYMDYSDDTCMTEFTPEQANRMRCSLLNWRPQLYEIAYPNVYVDFLYTGTETGTEVLPFNTLAEGLALVEPAGAITLAAGDSTEILTITQNVTLQSGGGTVRIGISGVPDSRSTVGYITRSSDNAEN
jgi:hypothetical protein